jgi:hypothetical protein
VEEIKKRLFNVFTLKAIVFLITGTMATQIPFDQLFSQFQGITAAVAAGEKMTAVAAVLTFGLAITNLIRKDPEAVAP